MLMSIIVTIILGGLAGWLASIVMNRNEEQGLLLNIVVGIVGAFLANIIITPLLGYSAIIDEFNFVGFLVALAGAIILLAIVNLVQRKRIR